MASDVWDHAVLNHSASKSLTAMSALHRQQFHIPGLGIPDEAVLVGIVTDPSEIQYASQTHMPRKPPASGNDVVQESRASVLWILHQGDRYDAAVKHTDQAVIASSNRPNVHEKQRSDELQILGFAAERISKHKAEEWIVHEGSGGKICDVAQLAVLGKPVFNG